MPRFYFHVYDGEYFHDHEGLLLQDLAEARTQAIVTSGEMLKEHGRKLWTGEMWTMVVMDENGKSVSELRFSAT